MTLTAKEIYEKILDSRGEDLGFTLTPGMAAAAIWYAEGRAITAYGDKVSAHLQSQRKRAEKCRYRHMAAQILGKTEYPDVIYHPSYGQHEEIGTWDFEI